MMQLSETSGTSHLKTPKREFISKILIVDDRPENLLTLESVLGNDKRKFFKASSGNEALKIALNEPLNLIMMDIQMPDMDGLETSRLLRLNTRTRHIPILFVSAINATEKHPIDGFEPGTVDFLFKPLNLNDTKAKVAIFEKIWMTQQELAALKKNHEKVSRDFDKFVYMASHDLKTPLRALTNLASWIKEDLSNDTNQNVKENLTLMTERITRINLMIEGLLEYSRAGRIQESPEYTNVKQLVTNLFESLQPSGKFTLNITGSWPEILTEKIKLEKIFRQLINNIFLHHDKTEGSVTVDCQAEATQAVYTVTDDGPGIKPVHYQAVFEMFQTLHPKDVKNNPGTGLAIIKKIIEDYGGTISVKAAEPRGAAFTFSWPL
jgi:two-component system sensor histidine kinase/response regulator